MDQSLRLEAMGCWASCEGQTRFSGHINVRIICSACTVLHDTAARSPLFTPLCLGLWGGGGVELCSTISLNLSTVEAAAKTELKLATSKKGTLMFDVMRLSPY